MATTKNKGLIILWIIWIILIINIKCHTYKLDYHNEQEAIDIVKDGISTRVHFGDIVDIGNSRRIVYVGNGNWRENDDPENKKWPKNIHHFTAEEINSWPQFVKTGFEILDHQLDQNQGYLDEASASHQTPLNNIQQSNNQQSTTTHYYTTNKIIIFGVIISFLCCFCMICIAGLFCILCNVLINDKHNKRKKYNDQHRLSSAQYHRIPIHDVNHINVEC